MPLNEYLIIPGTNNKYLIDEYKNSSKSTS